MATSPVVLPAVVKTSWLQHVGTFFKTVLHIGEQVAVVAEPFIAIAFPEIIPIYASAIGLATAAEATAVSATGTGPQKLAQVTATLTPLVAAWAAKNNIVWPEAEIKIWTSAVVDTLNKIPAPTAVK